MLTIFPTKPIYAIGNGEAMAYGQGAEWTEAMGPVYSTCRAFSLRWAPGTEKETVSTRKTGSSAWVHVLCGGTITDAASRKYHCLIRHFNLPETVTLDIEFAHNQLTENTGWYDGADQAFLITIPAGTPVYNWYPSREHMWVQLLLRGGASIADGKLTMQGAGDVLLCAAGDYPQLIAASRTLLAASSEDILASVAEEDAEMWSRRSARMPELKDHPLKADALRAADDVAMLIRAQQGKEGGVQAGHNYHLGYVRDQYGVFRGLLSVGLWEEAKAILGFYRDVFARFGKIANAQSMGNHGIFHVHEYDETEITGYLALQAADMLRITGDTEFFRSLIPLIRWALNSQLHLLHNGMLPFNGDETYIAGGILPRDCITTGALEATYLFVSGAEACLPIIKSLLGEEDWMADVETAVADVRARYEDNFRRPEGYVCNSLKRMEGLAAPEVRHGVCMKCHAFGWNHRVGDNWYVCSRCLPTAADESQTREYFIKSVVTMAVYTGSNMLDKDLLKSEIEGFLAAYRATGILPSRPDGSRCLGYDYGLLLYAAKFFGLEADDLLAKMLEIRDGARAWVEYYENNLPTGTCCRPWESGINIEAALTYLKA